MINSKIKMAIVFCLILTLCVQAAFSLSCSDSEGLSFMDCQETRPLVVSGGGGQGESQGNHSVPIVQIEACVDQVFAGEGHQTYIVPADVPEEYEIRFTLLDLYDDEKIIIKSFQCEPDNDCKVAVIDSSATVPLSITMTKRKFTLVSHYPYITAKFYLAENCPCRNAGFDRNGNKMLRFIGNDYMFEECYDVCEHNISSMIKTTSEEDVSSIYTLVWIGLRQIGVNLYQWTDGDNITVDLGTGEVNPHNFVPWYKSSTRSHYWDNDGVEDSETCFICDSEGWGESGCYEKRQCMCECNI